ncbi:MAG: hypothetical protein HQL26_05265 [Candidatus Omnitrophica bacterium]|nr:hypothetical protein [Candidatus Omnitrophota bacterium]
MNASSTPSTIKTNDYLHVVTQIREILRKAKTKSAISSDDHFIDMYWQIGRCMYQYVDTDKTRYGKLFAKRLAQDVGVDRTDLIRSLQFFREYHVKDARSKLTWTHYRVLMTVKDLQIRRELEQRALRETWSSRQLMAHSAQYKKPAHKKTTEQQNQTESPEFKIGWLYTYRIIRDHNSLSKFWIDLGFNLRLRVPETEHVHENDIVSANWENGRILLQEMLGLEEKLLFTYGATIEKLGQDGSLSLEIDCGFGILFRHKIWLKGLQTIFVDPAKNKRAVTFLERKLAPGQKIVIKMFWEEGQRPAANIFYHQEEKKFSAIAKNGICLNTEMLEIKFRKQTLNYLH